MKHNGLEVYKVTLFSNENLVSLLREVADFLVENPVSLLLADVVIDRNDSGDVFARIIEYKWRAK